jgi:hypothetical protein
MRLVITGTRRRRFDDAVKQREYDARLTDYVLEGLNTWWNDHCELPVLVHGGCDGVDRIGAQWASECVRNIVVFPADWSKGRRAGPERNQLMIDSCSPGDHLIAFPSPESVGTWDCVRRAWNKGLVIHIQPMPEWMR